MSNFQSLSSLIWNVADDVLRGWITNPPFGVSWKSDSAFVTGESQNPHGRFTAGTPRTSDGSLLFLQRLYCNIKYNESIVFSKLTVHAGIYLQQSRSIDK